MNNKLCKIVGLSYIDLLLFIEKNDCVQQRRASYDSERQDKVIMQCESDSSYSRKQCHSMTRQCWCVNPETGVELKGSRTRESLNCDTYEEDPKGIIMFMLIVYFICAVSYLKMVRIKAYSTNIGF